MALSDAVQTLQGFQGLQINQANMANAEAQRLQKEQQAKSMQLGSDYLRKYQQSVQEGKPDYNSLNEAILVVPELADNVLKGIGIQDKSRMQRAADDYITLTGALDDKAAFNRAAADRVNNVLEVGGNPVDILNLVKVYNEQGKEAAAQIMKPIGAALVNKGALKPELFAPTGGAAGQPASQAEMEYYLKLQQSNPEAAAKFAKARGYTDSPREQAQTPQERNLLKLQQMQAAGDPNAEAFAISSGLASKEGVVLSSAAQNELIKAGEMAEQSAVNVTKYIDLADRFKASDIAGGIFGEGGTVREALKSVTGSQDEVSKILSDWQKIRSGEAIASLPQGPATDADIKLALTPLPESANAAYMDSYLRGLAKISAYKERYARAKADFISDTGGFRDKKGVNFGRFWEGQKKAVLDEIAADPRFTAGASAPQQQDAQVIDWSSM